MFHVGEEAKLIQIEKWVVLNTINEADGIEVTINNKKEVYFDEEKDTIFDEIDEIEENYFQNQNMYLLVAKEKN